MTESENIERLAREVYQTKWKPGMPSWENASWADRDECKAIAQQSLEGH